MGEYIEDYAVVREILPAPSDSNCAGREFYRGTEGLGAILDCYWKTKRWYYLGEWHSHPNGLPVPSVRDSATMIHFAEQEVFGCPEPILFLLNTSREFGVFVWTKEDSEMIPLFEDVSNPIGFSPKSSPISKKKDIGSIRINSEYGETTIRDYLLEIFLALWREKSGFSGKRPLGNSDWDGNIHVGLIREGLVKGKIDDDGYIQECDDESANRIIEDWIRENFGD